MKGVLKTVQLPPFKQPHMFQQLGGVAVVADSTYAAMQGRKKLKVDWDLNPAHSTSFNSDRYKQELFASVHKAGKVVRNRGDFDGAFAGAARKLEADYYVPMLAHASMEPPVAVAEWQAGKVEAWCPTQNPQAVQEAVAAALGLTPKDVTCHVTLLGGGFGRKSKPDYVVEAALLSKAAGKPVKVVWTREDDIHFDYFHSVAAMHMKGGLDSSGKIQSWLFRSAFPPIASTFDAGAEYGMDVETGMALNELLFDVPHIRAENCPAKHHVRQGWMRAVCHLFHAFGVHSFVDELAHLNNSNYVDYFLKTIGPDRHVDLTKDGVKPWNNGQSTETFPLDTGRLRRVLESCAEKSGYAKFQNTKNRAIGIAAHRSFLSYVATAVEIAIDAQGNLTIPHVWTVADVGQIVMPDRVRAQFEGAAVFGASLALMGEITADAGRDHAVQLSQLPGRTPETGAGKDRYHDCRFEGAARRSWRARSPRDRSGDHRSDLRSYREADSGTAGQADQTGVNGRVPYRCGRLRRYSALFPCCPARYHPVERVANRQPTDSIQ